MLNLQLLRDARVVRRNLELSPRWSGKSSIRDAVHLAADGLRQMEDERRER